MRIFFILLFTFLSGCDDNKTVSSTPKTVPACSPYYVADFNNIIRTDRLKSGYSAELSGLCATFSNKYRAVSRCGAYQEDTGALQIVNASTIEIVCGRNEKLGATLNSQPSLLATEKPSQIPFTDSGEITIKFMILKPEAFSEVLESNRNFSNRKAFSHSKIIYARNVKKGSAYCLVTSNQPLKDNDIVQIVTIEDVTKDSVRTLNYSAAVYGSSNNIKISCVGVFANADPKEVLTKHFGKNIVLD